MTTLKADTLKSGMILVADLRDRLGRTLLSAGTTLTDTHLHGFKIWGITEAAVHLADEAQKPDTPQVQEKVRRKIDRLFRHADCEHPLMMHLRDCCLKQNGRMISTKAIPIPKTLETRIAHARVYQPDDLVKKAATVASLPSVYLRLMEVVYHPHSSASDIGKIVGEDPGITARLLRIVNSTFYGFPEKIETISHAVTLFGTDRLSELALATSILNAFGDIPRHLVDMESFWHHSLACGVFARIIAAKRREFNIERVFTAGLLHDIGRLILYMHNTHACQQALEKAHQKQEILFRMEKEIMGFHHGTVGKILCNVWHLPSIYKETVAWHHAPKHAKRFPIETAIIHVADILANTLCEGSSGERLVPPLDPGAWKILDLSADALPAIFDEGEHACKEAVQVILKDHAA